MAPKIPEYVDLTRDFITDPDLKPTHCGFLEHFQFPKRSRIKLPVQGDTADGCSFLKYRYTSGKFQPYLNVRQSCSSLKSTIHALDILCDANLKTFSVTTAFIKVPQQCCKPKTQITTLHYYDQQNEGLASSVSLYSLHKMSCESYSVPSTISIHHSYSCNCIDTRFSAEENLAGIFIYMRMITLYCLFQLFCYLQCKQQIASSNNKTFSVTSQAPLVEDLQCFSHLLGPRACHDLVQPMYLKYAKMLSARINTPTLYQPHQGRMLQYTSGSGNYMITLSSDGQNLQCKPQCTHLTFSTRHHYKTLETSSGQSMGDRVYSSASSTQTGNNNKDCCNRNTGNPRNDSTVNQAQNNNG